MWIIYYTSSEYMIMFLNTNNRLYELTFKNMNGAVEVSEIEPQTYVRNGILYADHVKNPEAYNDYYKVFLKLGWDRDIMNGIDDTDERVKKIIESPKIHKLLYDYLYKYKYDVIATIFRK